MTIATKHNYAGIAWALRSNVMSGQEKQENSVNSSDTQTVAPGNTLGWLQGGATSSSVITAAPVAISPGQYAGKLETLARLLENLTAYLGGTLEKMNMGPEAPFSSAVAKASHDILEANQKRLIQHSDTSTSSPMKP